MARFLQIDFMEQTSAKLNILGDGLLISYVTVLGYVIAFIYEFSFSSYFGIPYYFIEIGLLNIFVAILSVGIVIFLLRGILVTLESLQLIKDSAIGRYRARHLLMLNLLLIGYYSITSEQKLTLMYLIIGYALMIVLIEVFATIIHGKGIKSWKEKRKKLEEKWAHPTQEPETIVTNKMIKIFIPFKDVIPTSIFLSSAMLCILAFYLGSFNATQQSEFYTLSTDQNRVIVADYGNSLFSISVNKEKKTFIPSIQIIPKDELYKNQIFLFPEKIGPLKNAATHL